MRRDRRPLLVVASHFAADTQIDQRAVAAGPQEHAMQIATMHDRIGVAEPLTELRTEIDMGDFFGGERVHQAKFLDIDGHAARSFADAEVVEGMKGVWSELDARADFAQR